MAGQPDRPTSESTHGARHADARQNSTGQASAKPSVAIALQSDAGRAQATQVVAKGSGEVAEQILQLAFDHGVKVRTDADLATILSAVEVESEIPLEALTAVANILSYIYRAEQPLSTDQALSADALTTPESNP